MKILIMIVTLGSSAILYYVFDIDNHFYHYLLGVVGGAVVSWSILMSENG